MKYSRVIVLNVYYILNLSYKKQNSGEMFIWSKNFKNQNWQQDLSHRQCFSIIWPFFLQEMVKYSIQLKMLVRCDQLTKQNRKIVRMTDILFRFSNIFHWNDYLPINKIRLSLNENKWKFRYCSTMTGSDIMKRPFVNLYEDTQLPCKKLINLKSVKIVIFRANELNF